MNRSTLQSQAYCNAVLVGLALMILLSPSRVDAKDKLYGGRTISSWMSQLVNGNVDKTKEAHTALVAIGPPAIAPLIKTLKNTQNFAKAASVLGDMGERALPAVPTLTTYLSHKESAIRNRAFASIREIGPKAAPIIKKAFKKSRNLQAKSRLVQLMAAYSDQCEDMVPELMKLMTTKDRELSRAVETALVRMNKVSITPLIKALEGRKKKSRIKAAVILGRIGPAAKEAIPLIKNMIKRSRKKADKELLTNALNQLQQGS